MLVGLILAALVAAMLGLHFPAASKADSASPSAQASAPATTAGEKILRVGWLQEPDNLNPFIGIQGTSYELYHLNYDFLVGFDAKSYCAASRDRRQLDRTRPTARSGRSRSIPA